MHQALNLFDSHGDNHALRQLFESFQSIEVDSLAFIGVDIAPPGTLDRVCCGTFSYFESALNIGILIFVFFTHFIYIFIDVCLFVAAYSFSFVLASEILLCLKSIVDSGQRILTCGDNINKPSKEGNHYVFHTLQSHLGDAAQGFLRHHWEDETAQLGSKSKVRHDNI